MPSRDGGQLIAEDNARRERNHRERKLQEYDAIEDQIEESSQSLLWRLADWLVINVPNEGRGGDRSARRRALTMTDLADRRGRSAQYLRKLRRAGEVTADDRLPDVAPNAYYEALDANGWDLTRANRAIRERGVRFRDHRVPETATREQVRQLPPSERAAIVAEALSDPETREAVIASPEAAVAALGTTAEIQHREDQRRRPGPITPVGHLGWTPRRWMADALFLLWRLQNRLVDDQPPSEELREEFLSMVAEARRHIDRVEAMVQGDTELDRELAEAVARWETEFNR